MKCEADFTVTGEKKFSGCIRRLLEEDSAVGKHLHEKAKSGILEKER